MERRVTVQLMRVALIVMSDPHGRFYGYPLSKAAKIRSGVLYPMLDRMLEDRWLDDSWELPDETGAKRPRRYYTLTDLGRRELGGIAACALEDARVPDGLAWGAT
ncbi:MAG TPA: helix-turn-helix transcriptional regulator [Iamia sp.]|nr:helix-turn-helix transcriptional regulator [Iamia sp.]